MGLGRGESELEGLVKESTEVEMRRGDSALRTDEAKESEGIHKDE